MAIASQRSGSGCWPSRSSSRRTRPCSGQRSSSSAYASAVRSSATASCWPLAPPISVSSPARSVSTVAASRAWPSPSSRRASRSWSSRRPEQTAATVRSAPATAYGDRCAWAARRCSCASRRESSWRPTRIRLRAAPERQGSSTASASSPACSPASRKWAAASSSRPVAAASSPSAIAARAVSSPVEPAEGGQLLPDPEGELDLAPRQPALQRERQRRDGRGLLGECLQRGGDVALAGQVGRGRRRHEHEGEGTERRPLRAAERRNPTGRSGQPRPRWPSSRRDAGAPAGTSRGAAKRSGAVLVADDEGARPGAAPRPGPPASGVRSPRAWWTSQPWTVISSAAVPTSSPAGNGRSPTRTSSGGWSHHQPSSAQALARIDSSRGDPGGGHQRDAAGRRLGERVEGVVHVVGAAPPGASPSHGVGSPSRSGRDEREAAAGLGQGPVQQLDGARERQRHAAVTGGRPGATRGARSGRTPRAP